MWIWYFTGSVIILMALIQFISSRRKKPFSGLKTILPSFNQEASQEITPKTQNFVETLTGQSAPFFETFLSLIETSPNKLVAEWSIDPKLKQQLTEKYGQEFWHNSREILRLNHQNAVPKSYYHDYTIGFADTKKELNINSPGETLNCQLGLCTETGSFIPLARSNDVIIPKEN